MLSDYQAEGVVFAGSGYLDDPRGEELAQAVARARERGISVLALALRDFDCPRIVSDNRAAAYDVTDYVLSLGHRRVAFIGGPAGLYASRDRLEGYREAIADAGAEPDLVYEGDFSYERGYAAALQMIAEAEPPEAIIGANDETAIGALAALRQARIEVPGERVGGGHDRHAAGPLLRHDDGERADVPVRRRGGAPHRGRREPAGGDRAPAPRGAALDHRAPPPAGAQPELTCCSGWPTWRPSAPAGSTWPSAAGSARACGPGSRLRTAVGLVEVLDVRVVSMASIDAGELERAGLRSRAELDRLLARRDGEGAPRGAALRRAPIRAWRCASATAWTTPSGASSRRASSASTAPRAAAPGRAPCSS